MGYNSAELLVTATAASTLATGALALPKWEFPFSSELVGASAFVSTQPASTPIVVDIQTTAAVSLFTGTGAFSGHLATAITSTSATSINLDFAPTISSVIKIGSEYLRVTAVTQPATATPNPSFWVVTVTRGYAASTAATATIGTAVFYAPPIIAPATSDMGTQVIGIVPTATSASTTLAAPSQLLSGAVNFVQGVAYQINLLSVGTTTTGSDMTLNLYLNRR